ncbi:MAG: MFS transporter [Alphaproteobacteria bacterium]|nr:MAG: MFS transporter [Alphaproteobacteria bacterium]
MTRALSIVGLVFLIAQLHRSAGGVLALELGSAHGLAPAAIGMIVGVMPLASAGIQIPLGMLLDRFGVRLVLSILLLLASAGTLGFALAQTTTELVLARVAIGIGFAASMSSVYLVSMSWTSPERVGMAAATLVSIPGSIGAVMGTTPLAIAFASFGWTDTFFAMAALTLVLSATAGIFLREGPRTGRRGPPEKLADNLRTFREIVGHRDLQRIIVMAFCFAGPFMAVGGLWAGPYLRDMHNLSPAAASAVILALVIVYNVGTFVIAFAERLFGGRRRVVLGAAGVTIVTYTVLALFPQMPFALALPMLFASALAGPYFILLAAQCRSFVPAGRIGRTVTTMSLAGIAGTFFMQWATGLTVEALSNADGTATLAAYRSIFGLPAVILALCSLFYLPVRDLPRQDQPPPD